MYKKNMDLRHMKDFGSPHYWEDGSNLGKHI